MNDCARLSLLLALSATLSLAAPALQAQVMAGKHAVAASAAADDAVILDFVNADIEAVARTMATLTGANVVVDPRVQGTMTLTSTVPVTPGRAIALFSSQLRTQGHALIRDNGIYLVVPEAEARIQGTAVSSGRIGAGNQIQTHIFRLTHEDADNLVPVLRPLISPNNTINVEPGSNALVITDYGDNLRRLARIIAALDVAEATDIEIVRLRHAVATDLAPLVMRLLEPDSGSSAGRTVGAGGNAQQMAARAGGGYRTTLVPDARSNALIIRAANAVKLAQARRLIERLDLPPVEHADGSSGNIHVVYLKNADASKLAVTLRAALDALPGTGESTPSGAGTVQAVAGSGAGSSGGLSGGLQSGIGSSLSGGLESGPTIDTAASNQPSTGGQIQADPSTNSLIISAPEPIYRELRRVIDKLDQRRAQVFVESLIAEVRADRMAEFGVQWQGILGNKGDRNIGVIGSNFNAGTSNLLDFSAQFAGVEGTAAVSPPAGINLGLVHRYGGTYVLSALANFIQSTQAGNVLSTPTLLTLDNEEARIVVGQNVPLVTGSYTNTGSNTSALNPFQTFERTDVGLTLRVRPQISENGTVKMVIYQEVSSVDPTSRNSPQGLTTNKRAIESSVLVDDGSIVVLGGLMEDEFTSSVDKVPGLGDIPVVGNLFRSEGRKLVKTNLMVFLRPIIVRDAAATESFSLDRYDYMRAAQSHNQPQASSVLQINRAPVIPPVFASDPEAWTRPAPPAPLADELHWNTRDRGATARGQSATDSLMPASGEGNYYGGSD